MVDLPSRRDPARIDVEFLTSAPDLARCPVDAVREVAFAGRSNAGKSSVLNRLTGSRQTAKVSKTPGRTQLLNLFSVRTGGRLVDLPGYGYAKADRTAQQRWQQAVNDYLAGRPNLVGLIVVMDIRHPLQPLDLDVVRWAHAAGLPLLLLLNKADKLKSGARQRTLLDVRGTLAAAGITSAAAQVVTFSALRAINVDEVVQRVCDWLAGERAAAAPEPPAPD